MFTVISFVSQILIWGSIDFGGQSTSGVKRLFLGVKRLHLLGVKRLGGQTTGYRMNVMHVLCGSETAKRLRCFFAESNGPTVNQPDRSTNTAFRQIIV